MYPAQHGCRSTHTLKHSNTINTVHEVVTCMPTGTCQAGKKKNKNRDQTKGLFQKRTKIFTNENFPFNSTQFIHTSIVHVVAGATSPSFLLV